LTELPYKTEEWLVSEVLADRGETVVLEPAALRGVVARRARELEKELELKPARKRPSAGRA
jgi:predicted DNA-binding transcriptional regulator YafY